MSDNARTIETIDHDWRALYLAERKKIEEHNAECVRLCKDRNCVRYLSRDQNCPECPLDWMIK